MPDRSNTSLIRTSARGGAVVAASLVLTLSLITDGARAQVPPTPPARPAPAVPAVPPATPQPPMPALAPRAWGQFDSDLWRLDAALAGQAGALRGQAIAAEAMGRAMSAGADAFRSFGGIEGLAGLEGLRALDGLRGLEGLGALAPMAS